MKFTKRHGGGGTHIGNENPGSSDPSKTEGGVGKHGLAFHPMLAGVRTKTGNPYVRLCEARKLLGTLQTAKDVVAVPRANRFTVRKPSKLLPTLNPDKDPGRSTSRYR